MQDKKKMSYVDVFRYIRNRHQISFNEAMIDYELGMKNALMQVFTGIKMKGCWFHYGQALIRQFQKMPDGVRYRPDIKEEISKFISLPLLPANKIEPAYEMLKRNIQLKREIFSKTFSHTMKVFG